MTWQRFKLSSFYRLLTAADFVDYIMKTAQSLMTCIAEVVEDGKTNLTKKMTSIGNRGVMNLADFRFRPPTRPRTDDKYLSSIYRYMSTGNK
jgi:hypothetical protein